MEDRSKLIVISLGSYGENKLYVDYMRILPKGRCIEEDLSEGWLTRSLERLKKSENPEYIEDDLGDWALPPEQYPRW